MNRLEVLDVVPVIAWEIAAFRHPSRRSLAVRLRDATVSGSAWQRRCRVRGLCFEVLFIPDVLYCLTYFHVLEHTHVSRICPGD